MARSDVTERRKARGLSRGGAEGSGLLRSSGEVSVAEEPKGPDCFGVTGCWLWKVSKVAMVEKYRKEGILWIPENFLQKVI